MKVSIYLTFDDGKCAQAFDHYKEVFGSNIQCMMTYATNPEQKTPLSADKAKQIMHMSMRLTEDMELMGCDTPPEGVQCEGMEEEKFVPGNNMTINLEPDSQEHADKLIAALSSKGGKIMMPMAKAFWGCYFGMCKDPFGITWSLNYPMANTKEEKKEED